jgi:hypothetical protein
VGGSRGMKGMVSEGPGKALSFRLRAARRFDRRRKKRKTLNVRAMIMVP